MGTTTVIATSNSQILATRTIFGAFVVIFLILVFYVLFRTKINIKGPAFAILVGVIVTGTVILFTIAINAIINDTAAIV